MKKTVQIVSIPINKQGFSINDLIKKPSLDAADEVERWKISYYGMSTGIWKAQQLLVLSDDEIQEKDKNCFSEMDLAEGIHECFSKKTCIDLKCKKIIASYPQLEGTLPISKETVQAWIDSGTPGEGSVTMLSRRKRDVAITINSLESDWKEYVVDTDPQGNLLLEFDKKYKNTGNDLSDLAEKAIDKIIANATTKPSIPTDEEIYKEANTFAVNSDLWGDGDSLGCLINGYENGYKKALKDLGHIQ